jgi:hypothetical protein
MKHTPVDRDGLLAPHVPGPLLNRAARSRFRTTRSRTPRKMRMTSRSAFVLAAGPGPGRRRLRPRAKVIPAQSEIDFSHQADGRLRSTASSRSGAPTSPSTRRSPRRQGRFTIDSASATFGSPEVDSEVPKPAWFNVAKFPTATFASTAIKASGAGKFAVQASSTIKGTSKDVTVPVALAQSGGVTTATGQFAIKRNEFKIGEGEWADTSQLADDVLVKFKIALSGVGPL